jgi:hypothetical protein
MKPYEVVIEKTYKVLVVAENIAQANRGVCIATKHLEDCSSRIKSVATYTGPLDDYTKELLK